MQGLMLRVVYADCERFINVKIGWADSSRRIWHFISEDAAFKEGAVILKRDFSSPESKAPGELIV